MVWSLFQFDYGFGISKFQLIRFFTFFVSQTSVELLYGFFNTKRAFDFNFTSISTEFTFALFPRIFVRLPSYHLATTRNLDLHTHTHTANKYYYISMQRLKPYSINDAITWFYSFFFRTPFFPLNFARVNHSQPLQLYASCRLRRMAISHCCRRFFCYKGYFVHSIEVWTFFVRLTLASRSS